jgi:two-component system, NarL family, sensor kinase
MPGPVLIALAVVGATLMVSGVALVIGGSARLSGALLALAGGGAVAAALLEHAGGHSVGTRILTVAVLVGLSGLAAYPDPQRWRLADLIAFGLVAVWIPVGIGAAIVDHSSLGDTLTRALAPQTVGPLAAVALCLQTAWRFERAGRDERRTLVWLAIGAGIPLIVGFAIAVFLPTASGAVVAVGLWVIVGPALILGQRDPDRLDAQALGVRFAEILCTSIVFIALFGTVQALLSLLTEDGTLRPGLVALAAALCAFTLHPTRIVLRRVLDELLFGGRPDALSAATDVAGVASADPSAALEVLRATLVLPYAVIMESDAEIATSGTPVAHTRRFALELSGDTTAELVVGLRPGDLRLTDDDGKVIRLALPLLAQTIRSQRLAAQVQAAREAVVTAREEERRRIRRDLHDGLGPRLSGIAFIADAVRSALRSDPERALDHLTRLRRETEQAIDDIRRLVYAMRPPALDELGLLAAVAQQTAGLRTPAGDPFNVRINALPLPSLPAAAEAAAYRIAVEATANSARHSGTTTADLTLSVDGDALVLSVRDEGRRRPWIPGVGITSMRERVAEVGGELVVGKGRVEARLPLATRSQVIR